MNPLRASLVTLVLAAALAAPPSVSGQQPFAEGLSVASDAYIRIYSDAEGSVRIRGWDRDSVAVTGHKDAAAGRFGFGGDRTAAKMGLWGDGASGGRADLEVRVPRNSTLWVKVRGASVEVSEFGGGVDVYSVTGGIRVSGSPRQIYAESMGGTVDIAGASRSVRAKTGGSPITFQGQSDDLSLTTVGGGITVTGPRIRSADFETVTGDILFDGELARGSSVAFHTHSGAVELRLPAATGADVTVTSIEGTLDSDFPLGAATDRPAARGTERQFTVGGSGASVSIRTFSGPVRIRRK